MTKIGLLREDTPVPGKTYGNYTHVSGIYSTANEPMFLAFVDNVQVSGPWETIHWGRSVPNAIADSNSARVLRSIVGARIPAARPELVWENDELLP